MTEASPTSARAAAVTNLAGLVSVWADERADAEALVSCGAGREALTWAELDQRVEAVSAGLAARGLVAGHRVALLGRNSTSFVVAYLAVLRAGFVAVPLDPDVDPARAAELLAESGARLVLGPESLADGRPCVPLTPNGLAGLVGRGDATVDSPRDAEALAALLFTAGTSGGPRAAMLPHRALLAHVRHVDRLGVVAAGDTVLALLPMFHVFGLNAVVGGWLIAGARLVVAEAGTDPYEVVAAERVSQLPVTPAVLRALLEDDRHAALGGLQVVSGAAPLPDALARDFVRRTGAELQSGYGLTEAGPGVSLSYAGPLLGHGHVGRALPGVEIRVGDGADPGEPGEIAVRGDNLFTGYWPDGHGGPDADGWFGTGDIGYLDAADELFLVDRAGELVSVGGFAVYPAEVEAVVAALPGVQAVAVVAQRGRTGDKLVAFVVGEVTAEAVLGYCADRLVRYKRPGQVRLLDALPRGATGKIRKGVLREFLADRGRS